MTPDERTKEIRNRTSLRVVKSDPMVDVIISEGLRLGYIDKVWVDDDGDTNIRLTEAGEKELAEADEVS